MASLLITALPYLAVSLGIVLGAVSLHLLQYFVLRVVLGNSSGAARAWVPVSVLVDLVGYFAVTAWFRAPSAEVQLVPTIPQVVAFAILWLAQGWLLAEMLGTRAAVVAWPLVNVAASAVVLVLLETGILKGAVSFLGAVEGTVITGAIYGGLTGAALVALARGSATEPAPAAR